MESAKLLTFILLGIAFICFIVDALHLQRTSTWPALTPFGLALWVLWTLLRSV